MCDTFVALPDATADGSVIFGKNSDREPNEAHEVLVVPAGVHDPGSEVRCTYISIDQVDATNRVLLAKPYWIWGAEMGVNEHGVAIGNEAVFTGIPREKEPGLLGMDLLRLALERASTAEHARDVITTLLERHGQEGQAGHTHNLKYDNSFIIADRNGALVLETMGRDWVVRRVSAVDSISNAVTTGREWDSASAGVAESIGEATVAKKYSDFLYTTFSDARARQCRTFDALSAAKGRLQVPDAMALLRDHGPTGEDAGWGPDVALTGQTVCAHAGFGPIRVSQSTGSLVAHITPERTTAWVTATSAPCTSTFKPVWLDTGLPETGPAPGRWWDPASLWWRHEQLHREILQDYPTRAAVRMEQRDELERELQVAAAECESMDDRWKCSLTAFERVDAFEAEWLATVQQLPNTRTGGAKVLAAPYRQAWRRFDKAAHRP